MRKNMKLLPDGKIQVTHKEGPNKGETQIYKQRVGSREQVLNETAYETSGRLTKDNLTKNKHGYIVSVVKQRLGHTQKNLGKHLQKKGSRRFGSRVTKKSKKSKKNSKSTDNTPMNDE
jgi:hypothetical protein